MPTCIECRKETLIPYKRTPNRHMCSPNRFKIPIKDENDKVIRYETKVNYCSNECADIRDKDRLQFFAELDKNCSDCVNFKHEKYITKWDGVKFREGVCLKKNMLVSIEPLQPSDRFDYETGCFESRYKWT